MLLIASGIAFYRHVELSMTVPLLGARRRRLHEAVTHLFHKFYRNNDPGWLSALARSPNQCTATFTCLDRNAVHQYHCIIHLISSRVSGGDLTASHCVARAGPWRTNALWNRGQGPDVPVSCKYSKKLQFVRIMLPASGQSNRFATARHV